MPNKNKNNLKKKSSIDESEGLWTLDESRSSKIIKLFTGAERWEWMGMGIAGVIINDYEMDHSLIPYVQHQ